MNLVIIDGSVRQGRATERVTKWVKAAADALEGVEAEVVDLKELAMPMFDEPILPMINKNRQPTGGVKTWLDALESADGLVVVTPEYNHAMPSGLKNAIDYINFQVMHKPFLVVSHGANGGARSMEQVKQALNASLGAVPLGNGVTINGMVGFGDMINESGEINSDEVKKQEKGLVEKLELLVKYAEALKRLRV